MNETERKGNFGISLLYSFIINFVGVFPGVALLIGHFAASIPIWWSYIAFGLWILWIFLWILAVKWIGYCSSSIKPTSNRNPYSVGTIENTVG